MPISDFALTNLSAAAVVDGRHSSTGAEKCGTTVQDIGGRAATLQFQLYYWVSTLRDMARHQVLGEERSEKNTKPELILVTKFGFRLYGKSSTNAGSPSNNPSCLAMDGVTTARYKTCPIHFQKFDFKKHPPPVLFPWWNLERNSIRVPAARHQILVVQRTTAGYNRRATYFESSVV